MTRKLGWRRAIAAPVYHIVHLWSGIRVIDFFGTPDLAVPVDASSGETR